MKEILYMDSTRIVFKNRSGEKYYGVHYENNVGETEILYRPIKLKEAQQGDILDAF